MKASKIVHVQEEVKCRCREGGFDPTRFPIVHKSQNAGAVILVVSTRHEAYLRGLGGGWVSRRFITSSAFGLGVTKQTALIKYYESNIEDGIPRNFFL